MTPTLAGPADAPAVPVPGPVEQHRATPSPAMPAASGPADPKALADPRLLLTQKPMPTAEHTFKLPDGSSLTILLQGLTWIEKGEIDALEQEDRIEAEKQRIPWVSRFAPRYIARAACKPNGKRAYVEQTEWVAFAEALIVQVQPGEVAGGAQKALDLSGYGVEAEKKAGKD